MLKFTKKQKSIDRFHKIYILKKGMVLNFTRVIVEGGLVLHVYSGGCCSILHVLYLGWAVGLIIAHALVGVGAQLYSCYSRRGTQYYTCYSWGGA